MDHEKISWETMEFEYREKSQDWYWILGIIVVIGALISVILKNTLFALFLLLGGFIVAIYAGKHPDEIICEADHRRIRINDKVYMYNSIDTFWVDDKNEDRAKLLMTLKSTLAMQIVIPIEGIDPNDVREHIGQYVHEVEQNETITERLMDLVKF